ncbi:MAG: hypothetical protein R3C03_12610 [Pirellulaceae bacterium]
MRYAADGIFGFSRKPARILLLSGFAQTVLGVTALTMFAALAIFGVAGWEFGWPLGVSLLAILGGIQLLGLGIVAELGFRIYEQSKSRPSYIVENRARLGQLRNNETANEPMPSPTSDMPHRKAG